MQFSCCLRFGPVAVAAIFCAALVQGQDWPRGDSNVERLTAPQIVSLSFLPGDGGEPVDETSEFAESGDALPEVDAGDISPSDMLPPTGLTASDIFPFLTCDESLRDLAPVCDAGPTRGLTIFVGYDAWRGVSDGSWENNGIHTGANFGTRLGSFSDWTGIGMQVGGSVGVYDWAGSDYRTRSNNEAEVQAFITYGFFRKANENSNWSAAVVQDWMLNSNFGVFAQNPTLSQFRGQLGYATSACNEFGVWGAIRAKGDNRVVGSFGPTTWRPIDQISAYWHHKWSLGGPDTWLSFGVPEQTRLAGGGSLGDYLVTATANAPLSNATALYASVTYMHQSGSPGPGSAQEDAWNFVIGLSFYSGRNARSSTVAGQCWMPQMPVANNGSFLVDTSQNF